MSAPHIILDNLPSLRQNYKSWWKFDKVMTKTILLVFFETQCISCIEMGMIINLTGVTTHWVYLT